MLGKRGYYLNISSLTSDANNKYENNKQQVMKNPDLLVLISFQLILKSVKIVLSVIYDRALMCKVMFDN